MQAGTEKTFLTVADLLLQLETGCWPDYIS
jgi:hypothetical protein